MTLPFISKAGLADIFAEPDERESPVFEGALIPPEVLEAIRRKLRVSHSVLDVLVPQVMLNRPRVVPIVSELITGRVSQHVRMNRKT